MKKIIVLTTLIIMIMMCSCTSNTRQAQGTVLYTTDTYSVIETIDGNIWEIDGVVNSKSVILTFDTCNTDDVADDIIVNVR